MRDSEEDTSGQIRTTEADPTPSKETGFDHKVITDSTGFSHTEGTQPNVIEAELPRNKVLA